MILNEIDAVKKLFNINGKSFQESLEPCTICKVWFDQREYYCLKENNYAHFFTQWDDLLEFLRFYDFGAYEKGVEWYE